MKSLNALVRIWIVYLVSVGGIGCLSQVIPEVARDKKLLDYATAKNGATVIASMGTPGHRVRSMIDSTHDGIEYSITSTSTPGHDAATAINGIASSENWDKGEGWEVQFERIHGYNPFLNPFDDNIPGESQGCAWIEVHFPEPKRVNRIVIHTLDSSEYPASKFGIYSGLLRVWREKRWETLGRIKTGKIEYRTQASYGKPAGGKIEFRFSPMKITKVQFVVYRSNDRKVVDRTFGSVIEKSTARIVEIEVTGNESADKISQPPESPELDTEGYPEF